jgi:hypothetical protein
MYSLDQKYGNLTVTYFGIVNSIVSFLNFNIQFQENPNYNYMLL